jgi:hypothetical protein
MHDRIRNKSEDKAAKARARYVVRGWDLLEEMERLYELARAQGIGRKDLESVPPTLTVRRGRKRHVTGRAWQRCRHVRGGYVGHRIVITVGIAAVPEVLATLAHEVAHILAPRKVNHGEAFWSLLGDLIEARWGKKPDFTDCTDGTGRHNVCRATIEAVFSYNPSLAKGPNR